MTSLNTYMTYPDFVCFTAHDKTFYAYDWFVWYICSSIFLVSQNGNKVFKWFNVARISFQTKGQWKYSAQNSAKGYQILPKFQNRISFVILTKARWSSWDRSNLCIDEEWVTISIIINLFSTYTFANKFLSNVHMNVKYFSNKLWNTLSTRKTIYNM